MLWPLKKKRKHQLLQMWAFITGLLSSVQLIGMFSFSNDSFGKTLMLGKIEGRRRRGRTEDEMVGWHHRLDGHGFGWTPGVGDGQGGLACCSSCCRRESDTTGLLN